MALGGRSVTLWEVSSKAELNPLLTSEMHPAHHATHLDVDTTLRRWNIPIVQGSRWVGTRGPTDGPWVIAPVRTLPPAPPPNGHERRSGDRVTLELAGLCLGLLDRREQAGAALAPDPAPSRDITTLPGIIAHELGNRLTTARAALQMAMESIGRWTEVQAARRLEIMDDLGHVMEDIDRGTQFLRAVKDRARGALARWERFDAARVIQSCCTLEARVLRERARVELAGALEPTYLHGDPNALYDALVNVIRNAADATVGSKSGQPAVVTVSAERKGASLYVSVSDRGAGIPAPLLERIFEPGFTTKGFGEGTGMGLVLVQDVVRNMFGGNIALDSTVGAGTTVTLALPIPPQRGGASTAPGASAQAPASTD